MVTQHKNYFFCLGLWILLYSCSCSQPKLDAHTPSTSDSIEEAIPITREAQVDIDWYSERTQNGITIQNSYPKGGPYLGVTKAHFNHSYLVFFSRLVNHTKESIDLKLLFSGEEFPIPDSPDTYVKLLLPADTMTMNKVSLFSYGITELATLEGSSSLNRIIAPDEDILFYVVALFYQTDQSTWKQERGGNRAELIMDGDLLYYNLLPQVDAILCGSIALRP